MILLFGVILAIVPSAWSVCGGTGTLTPQNPTYSFATPNYPSLHPTPITCTWNINSLTPTKELSVECNVNTARDSGCLSSLISFKKRNIVSRLCGTGLLKVKLPGSSTIFTFESKLSVNSNYKGLSCKISYIPKSYESIPTPFPPDASCKCGQKGGNRIVGGNEVTPNEYPWQAILFSKLNGMMICGGSVILKDWILTAAHCIKGAPASNFEVVLGEHDYAKTDQNTEKFDVQKIISHENFHQEVDFSNDIALLKLQTPATYNLLISPICLPFNYKMFDVSDETATITGWGLTVPGNQSSVSNVLKELNVKLLKHTDCTRSSGYGWLTSQVNEKMVCGIADKQSACQGDSGGPVVWQNPTNKFFYELGVVSFGGKCASSRSPEVFTKVQVYLDWIKEKTGAGNEFCIK